MKKFEKPVRGAPLSPTQNSNCRQPATLRGKEDCHLCSSSTNLATMVPGVVW